jgi:hypothetical protein
VTTAIFDGLNFGQRLPNIRLQQIFYLAADLQALDKACQPARELFFPGPISQIFLVVEIVLLVQQHTQPLSQKRTSILQV